MKIIFFNVSSFLLLVHFFSIDARTFFGEFNKEISKVEISLSVQKETDSLLELRFNSVVKIFENKNYVESLRLALDMYEITKYMPNIKIHKEVTYLIAEIYKRNRNHYKALEYYKRLLNLLKTDNTNNSKEIISFQNKYFAENYLKLGAQYQLLKLNDSAIFFYEKLAQLTPFDDEMLSNLAVSFTNLAAIYQKDTAYLDRYEKAIEYAEKAIEIHKGRNKKINQASAINNLANVYLMQGDYQKSKKKYFEGIHLIERDTSTKAIRTKASLYFNLAWAMRNLKEFEAYDNLEISVNMENDLRNLETQEMLERVTAKYNITTVRHQEKLKRQLVIIQKQKAERNLWMTLIISTTIIIILIFYLEQNKLRQKNLNLEFIKQELIQRQHIENIRSESQIRILNAAIDGKESERKKIADTLHDHVSALLSSASLHIQASKKTFNGSIPNEIIKSQNIIHEASHKIRDLSHTLISSVLLKFGLEHAVRDIAEKYSNIQLDIVCEIEHIRRYNQDFEIKVYNIVQEFLNNILKHSEATFVKILLKEENKNIYLIIQDNGKGFDESEIDKSDGLGISQISSRVQIMKGKFVMKTKINKGTMVQISLPIEEIFEN